MTLSNAEALHEFLDAQLGAAADFVSKTIYNRKSSGARLFYFKSLCDEEMIQRRIVAPFTEIFDDLLQYTVYLHSLHNQRRC